VLFFVGEDGQIVCTRLGVVVPWKADGVAVVDGWVVGHAVLRWGCGLGMGKAFDFVCKNFGEVRIIVALEFDCRQAGQMLYPYVVR